MRPKRSRAFASSTNATIPTAAQTPRPSHRGSRARSKRIPSGPTWPLREAQQLAAEAYGSRHTFFVTNGTSTANKIVTQSLVAPGDIVLLDRNCHQSHHYGMMLAGAQVIYLEAYPLPNYSMYGAVPLREITSKLLSLKRAGKPDRVKMISLTNCTFDGIVYDVSRVMEECLAIKVIWCSCGTRHGSPSRASTRCTALEPR